MELLRNSAWSILVGLSLTACTQGISINTGTQAQLGSTGWVDTRSTVCTVPPVTITHSQSFVANSSQNVFVDTHAYPQALCNDGTPAVFSIRPGFGVAASRWVIFLDGGGSCWDNPTCSDRATTTPDLITSNTYLNTPLGLNFGVLIPDSTKNPYLYDATMVRVHYCSSDGWTGTKPADPNQQGVIPGGWHFQGHAIVQAVIKTLLAQYGMNQASELLLVGSSAGGVGTFNNLGWVSQAIPSTIRFVASNDAGFINEVAGYDVNQPDGVSTAPGTPYDAVNPLQEALWGGTGDFFCEMTALTAQDHINCAMGPKIVAANTGWLRIPMFVRQSLADGVQLKQEGLDIQSNPPAQQSQGYQTFFAQQMRNSLNNANNFTSVFAELSNVHGQMDSSDYYTKSYTFNMPTGGTQTLQIAAALGIWYQNPCQITKWMQ